MDTCQLCTCSQTLNASKNIATLQMFFHFTNHLFHHEQLCAVKLSVVYFFKCNTDFVHFFLITSTSFKPYAEYTVNGHSIHNHLKGSSERHMELSEAKHGVRFLGCAGSPRATDVAFWALPTMLSNFKIIDLDSHCLYTVRHPWLPIELVGALTLCLDESENDFSSEYSSD